MNTKKVFLVTGGTGFVGSHIIKDLHKLNIKTYILARNTSDPKLPENKNAIVIKGDITKPRLGISDKNFEKIKNEVTDVVHCAALYDTSSTKTDLMRTNCKGTKNVLKICHNFTKLKTLDYLSTIYVSGSYEGSFPEDKLPKVQRFHNFYEESKYLAERQVASYKKPKRIFRLPIVTGQSKTGKTSKFDGIYKLIALLNKGRLFFYPGDCHGPVNLIPVDFASNFIVGVITSTKFINKTFNMIDPKTSNYKKFINYSVEVLGSSYPYFVFPGPLWNTLVKITWKVPVINLRSLNLFNQKIVYTNKNYLKACNYLNTAHPNLIKYLPRVIAYYQKHAKN